MKSKNGVQSDYRRAINLLRGLAALYVAAYHLRYFSTFDWFNEIPVIRFGYLGVDLFFILSGLIISHVYLVDMSKTNKTYWFKFIWFRLARIFPTHFFIMLVMLVVALVLPVFDPAGATLTRGELLNWFTLSLMIRQWLMPEAYTWNTPAWSISAEFFAYLVIFPIVVNLERGRSLYRKGFLLFASGLALLVFLIAMADTVNVTSTIGPLVRVSGGFLIGCGLFCLMSHLEVSLRWDTNLKYSWVALLLSFYVSLHLLEQGTRTDFLIISAFIVLICATYLAKGPISKAMSIRCFFWLGEVSFALYLCHIPVMLSARYLAENLRIERGFWFGIFCMLASLLLAHVTYRYVELPSRRILRDGYNIREESLKASSNSEQN